MKDLIFILGISLLKECASSPYVISDDRVRGKDITPVLGRGYSIRTDSFQSTCLVVEETTVPTYDYDYYFTDFTKTSSGENELDGKVAGSFGYFGIKGEFSASVKTNSKFESETHVVASTMRIERYYSSVKEERSSLSNDAYTLIQNEDYVGFFKACGPNYVRSIRRAQEVTAIFTFQSSSKETATEFASKLKVSGWGRSIDAEFSSKAKFRSATQSLQIKILGFGLGLDEGGAETLVARSLEDYNKVMNYAFRSMTQAPNSAHVGMIYGIEVVPWVENTSFQVAAKLYDDEVEFNMPLSLIPRAITIEPPLLVNDPKKRKGADGTILQVRGSPKKFDKAKREDFKCKDPTHLIDYYGYCCEVGQMEKKSSGSESMPKTQPTGKVSVSTSGGRSVLVSLGGSPVKDINDKTVKLDNVPEGQVAIVSTDGGASVVEDVPAVVDGNGNETEATTKPVKYKSSTGSDVELKVKFVFQPEGTTTGVITFIPEEELENYICSPKRILDPTILKNNMSQNGEFVAEIDRVLRLKMNNLSTLSKCVSAANSIPYEKYKYHYLKPQDTVLYDAVVDFDFTLTHLRAIIDPTGTRYGLMSHVAKELDEFIDMYYEPCLGALYGTNVGNSPGTDPKYFKAQAWYEHDECNMLSCLGDEMRWDRVNGGCIPSLMALTDNQLVTNKDDPPYPENPEECSLTFDDWGGQECKHSSYDLRDFFTKASTCWNSEAFPGGTPSPNYLLTHFCMPQLSGRQAVSEDEKGNIDDIATACLGAVDPPATV